MYLPRELIDEIFYHLRKIRFRERIERMCTSFGSSRDKMKSYRFGQNITICVELSNNILLCRNFRLDKPHMVLGGDIRFIKFKPGIRNYRLGFDSRQVEYSILRSVFGQWRTIKYDLCLNVLRLYECPEHSDVISRYEENPTVVQWADYCNVQCYQGVPDIF